MQKTPHVIVVGAGPAGLIAAETLSKENIRVTIYDRMPSPGRKFLMAGHGGLNLTNALPLDCFIARYGASAKRLEPAIRAFTPDDLRAFADGLGAETFVGTSGRVFPKGMKAAPLLKAWRDQLEKQGVSFVFRARWKGWDGHNGLVFETGDGTKETVHADAVLLALGGASWPHLGSDGTWTDIAKNANMPLAEWEPSNCGFVAPWSDFFAEKFAGYPLKPVALSFGKETIQGEITLTKKGVEGGPVYALSGALREAIKKNGAAILSVDLRPSLEEAELARRFSRPRGSLSLSTYIRKTAGLSPQAVGLIREVERQRSLPIEKPEDLAQTIKKLPLRLTSPASIARAISSAGGLKWEALDVSYMLLNRPGVFAAGEMIDWDAPTGGFLLQACFSTGIAAAKGIINWVYKNHAAR